MKPVPSALRHIVKCKPIGTEVSLSIKLLGKVDNFTEMHCPSIAPEPPDMIILAKASRTFLAADIVETFIIDAAQKRNNA